VQQASHALLEFSFKAEYAYDMGMPQWLARIDHAVSFLSWERLFWVDTRSSIFASGTETIWLDMYGKFF
jgi:hypothetical protein